MSSPRLLNNRYEIGDTLGYGGMSEVHGGRDIRLGRDVAVKVLRADLARDPTFQLRFRREAQNAAALNHPAIVAVYDTGETDTEDDQLPYIVMEYVDGRTLRDIVKSEGPLPPRRAMEVMADASAALDFSHRHGIVHRDVKPANIMITRSGAVKVMDFGIARALADGQAAVTQTAAVIGTAQYLSPEQARGESVDARSDVYAAGCVLFELLTSEPPFTGDSPVAVAYQHVREDPRKPSDVNSTVPASLDAVVLKALSKNPANRYQSAAEMRADLVRVLSGQRPKAPMIMSEEDRTAMMAPPAATEVFSPGRHRSPDRHTGTTSAVAIDDDDGRRRRSWLIALVTLACVGVFILVAWLATAMFAGPEQPQKTPVPQLEGMTTSAARSQLTESQWLFDVTQCESTAEKVGTVVKVTPPPGTQVVKKNQRLTVCEGGGPAFVPVPDLYGKDKSEASTMLRDLGLVLGLDDQETEVEDSNLVGKIVDWDSKGDSAARGTTINVTVGKEIAKSQVPDVRSLSYDQAKSNLEAAGFKVKREERDSDQEANTVLEQSPAAGESVRKGSEITLVVSNGAQLTMPSLTGKSKDEAEKALKQMGWNGSIQEQETETDDLSKDDKVIGSSPAEGQKIGKNQTVTLQIGKYDSNPSTSNPPTSDGLFPPFG
ncbi:Stk1 family PASTA domain-containing Ser/Thr kinase [Saccharopolyspora gloriosae]|uniref:non-specific serine/threonine protein kinase n=1 Tax=Saccharopolyspora gloriosae TaxID=455344 RepID=A0A840NWR6_9PSEU|nr:Stk1 family PASTA domain-containing Ser/Thr kinase [Saccharopolyspora gloriosae]MBB5072547.1 serine/threonine-protein kinase [Saccharopolyspora gloriosae]